MSYAMNTDDLMEAANDLDVAADDLHNLDLDECCARFDAGSDLVRAALRDLADAYDMRARATSRWLRVTARALKQTAHGTEETDDDQAAIFAHNRAKL